MEIRINEEDFLKLLEELKHNRKQVTELQERGTQLLLENRELKQLLNAATAHIEDLATPQNWDPR